MAPGKRTLSSFRVNSVEKIGSSVSYRAKFSASEQKAHNRFIATKIHKEISELRAGVEASPTTPKRWVWELIQNAKDVNVGGKVRVRIEADLDDPDDRRREAAEALDSVTSRVG
jgi:hypothetical protein